jgi:N-acetylglucosaminyldiphosphoundecaprenol N-acetyl-beta-D-mannosaminyltransferase
MRNLIALLGNPLDNLTMTETIDRFVHFVAVGRADHKGHQVATVNVDFLVKALSDPELRFILQNVDMATIDGMPLVWGCRWLGSAVNERVAGSDFIPLLASRAAQEGLSIFLLGATPEVAARAADKLLEDHPGLEIAGVISPPFQSVLEMDPGIADEIRAADPDILLVAFGNPKQEKWIEVYGPKVKVPLMIGVGATLDFIAGEVKRAPKWMQKTGLEWIFRMLQEPRRLFKRYFKDLIYFSIYFTRQLWFQHPSKGRQSQAAHLTVDTRGQTPTLHLSGGFNAADGVAIWKMGQTALETTGNLSINLQDCTFLDSASAGSIMGLAKLAHDRGGQVSITEASPQARKIIAFHKLNHLFTADAVSPAEGGGISQQADSQNDHPGALAVKTITTNSQARVVVTAPGRLDGKSSPLFSQLCGQLLENNPHLIIDLGRTFHVSGAGLITLDQLTHQAKERQGNLQIIACKPNIHQVINNHNFGQRLGIYPDLAAATFE